MSFWQEPRHIKIFEDDSDWSQTSDHYPCQGGALTKEDGDLLPSEFEKDFNIDYYNEDFRKVEFYDEPSNDCRVLLEGFSYDEEIIPKFIEFCGDCLNQEANSVLLLYNFQYNGNINEKHQFRFLGAVQYK
ncbi:immunity 22 family protein [Aeribacillus composti]|uniref:Immunity 22 family protein n=1 Tax=Aeribacillus composti TaxID=1868734 RepID=A0ABY9WFD5_9BACI|nr:immunity 22 family protein [Aeribacillus composti]WNF34865.1 immunity 22 family protein [Aeribacillus composti]